MTDERGVTERIAGGSSGGSLAAVLERRAEIFRLTQASHDAVLRPAEPGGLSLGERAALAERMARHNGDLLLAQHFHDLLPADAEPALKDIADPAGPTPADSRISAILRHVDLVTRTPREAQRTDIEALQRAGISDADIVRLSELIAYVNYQVRVIAGLRLIGGAA